MQKDSNKYRLLFSIVLAIAIWLLPIAMEAQNNKYKIDDELYSIYVKAKEKQSSKECLPMAEEMLKKATAKGDIKAMTLAANIPMLYYYSTADDKKFNESAELLKKIAKETKQWAYYFFAYQYQVLRLSNSGRSAEALKVAEQMQQESLRENNSYGISASYKAMADIYFGRADYVNAKLYYEKGLEYAKVNAKSADISIYYAMLAMIARKNDNYAESLKYSEEGIKHAKNKISVARLELSRCYSLYLLKRYTDFLEQLKVIDSKTNMYGAVEMDTYYLLKMNACLLEKKYDEAMVWAGKSNNELNRLEQLRTVYEAMGNWEKAFEYFKRVVEKRAENLEQLHSKDLAEANAKFKNERLESENLRLELVNAKGRLEAAKSIARQKESDAANAKLEAYNKELKLHNSDLTLAQFKAENSLKKSELERQQAELARQKAQAEKEYDKHRWQMMLLVGGLFALTLIVISLVKNKLSSMKFIKTLKQKNDELAIERDRAQQSEKMKTMFIQNISHEIRTPLNAIVGFSDLMLNPNMELENEEKEHFKNIIHQNSDLLTGLVNDVLTLSELQSGKAKLNLSDCKCNVICRTAIETVMHRKPDDVELKFTSDVADDFTVESDSRRISQVIINFLTNAEKYTHQGTITLDCSITKIAGYVTFTVTDTGCGIPKEKQQQVFERFEKLDDFHQGIGLGLNICALIANLLDAKIGIDSSYVDGARFYFAVKKQ